MATAARIAARQAKDGDGITSQLADQMHANLGGRYVAIVELEVDETANLEDGTSKVKLVIETIEFAERASGLEDHLRDVQKHLWDTRQDEPTLLDGEPRQSETDLVTAGKATVETPA
jgi:hypothetical protein